VPTFCAFDIVVIHAAERKLWLYKYCPKNVQWFPLPIKPENGNMHGS